MSERLEFFIHDRPIERAPFHYTQCGLLDVWLLNGFTINEDDGYGPSFDIEDVEDLIGDLAAALAVAVDVDIAVIA